ncbi:hypothetical protein GQ44DRAFT_709398 [Phaeosphaeriaceae sp. PMI808]|nr:hypothetical protein GQ44DRAFT_709398 [Phaeosphaeriaceae sp. PMI808]
MEISDNLTGSSVAPTPPVLKHQEASGFPHPASPPPQYAGLPTMPSSICHLFIFIGQIQRSGLTSACLTALTSASGN